MNEAQGKGAKKFSRRRFVGGALAGAGALALAPLLNACGDNTATSSAVTTTSAATTSAASVGTTATTVPATAGAVSQKSGALNIMVNADDYNEAIPGFYDQVKTLFIKQYPNVTIKFDVVPNAQISDKLKVEGASGGGLHDAAVNFDLPTLAAGGYLEDISSQLSKWDGFAQLPDNKKQRISFGGKFWGMTISNNTNGLYYNADLLKAASIDPNSIKTMDDFTSAFQKIKAANLKASDGTPVWATSLVDSDWYLSNFTYGAGARLTDPTRSKVTFDTPELKEGFTLLRSLITNGYSPKPDKQFAINRGLMEQGKAAFWISGEWDAPTLKKALGDKMGFIQQPLWKAGATPLGGAEWVVPKGTKNLDLAVAWVLFMVSDPVQEIYVKQFHRPPTLPKMYDLPEIKNDPITSIIVGTVKDKAIYLDTNKFPDKPAVVQDFTDLLDKVIYSQDDIAGLLKTYDAKAQKDFK